MEARAALAMAVLTLLACQVKSISAVQVTTDDTASLSRVFNGTVSGRHVVDGDPGTAGNNASTTPSFYIDLKSRYRVSELRIWNYQLLSYGSRGIQNMTVGISDSGTSWTTVSTVTGLAREGTNLVVSLGGTNTTRYIRLSVTANWGDATYCGVNEVEVHGPSTTPVDNPFAPLGPEITVASVTSSSEISVQLATNTINESGISLVAGGGNGIGKEHLASGLLQINWVTGSGVNISDQWIRFDLGSEKPIQSMVVWNYNWDGGSAGYLSRAVQQADITLYADDGVTVSGSLTDVPFLPGPGMSTYDSPQLIDLSSTLARFVQIDVDSNYGDPLVGLAEVKFFEGTREEGILLRLR